ncbi:MAG: hypothetical protein O2783_02205 [Chloroflexi bacterium]|nr:hypothetical protein [Chloroflexota bacterium]
MTTISIAVSDDVMVSPTIPMCPMDINANQYNVPMSVNIRGERIEVRSVVDRWLIENRWDSGQPARLMYYECLMSKGLRITVYQDMDSNRWYW